MPQQPDHDLREIRKLVIIAMFSDDRLRESLVLKGGNALDLVYDLAARGSIDVDFSMEGSFSREQLPDLRARCERTLHDTFAPIGLRAFDVRVHERPPVITEDMIDFWGGYNVEFKLIPPSLQTRIGQLPETWRRNAWVIGPDNKKTFKIDISKHEYCGDKQQVELDHYLISVYSLEMMVIEKLRSICQQMEAYAEVVKSPGRSARARDFFDITVLLEKRPVHLFTAEARAMFEAIFAAKRVPLALLGRIDTEQCREFHRGDFPRVKDSVYPGFPLKDYDAYFDTVVDLCRRLHAFWNE